MHNILFVYRCSEYCGDSEETGWLVRGPGWGQTAVLVSLCTGPIYSDENSDEIWLFRPRYRCVLEQVTRKSRTRELTVRSIVLDQRTSSYINVSRLSRVRNKANAVAVLALEVWGPVQRPIMQVGVGTAYHILLCHRST